MIPWEENRKCNYLWIGIYLAKSYYNQSYSLFVLFLNSNDDVAPLLNEPTHEIMALSILRKLILQMCMCSHPVGLDVWLLVRPFIYFHTLCVWTAKALVRLPLDPDQSAHKEAVWSGL